MRGVSNIIMVNKVFLEIITKYKYSKEEGESKERKNSIMYVNAPILYMYTKNYKWLVRSFLKVYYYLDI